MICEQQNDLNIQSQKPKFLQLSSENLLPIAKQINLLSQERVSSKEIGKVEGSVASRLPNFGTFLYLFLLIFIDNSLDIAGMPVGLMNAFNKSDRTSKLLINIFIQFIYTFMIDLSSEHLSNTASKERSEQPLYEAAQLQQKSVNALRTAFNIWIRSLPMEERFLVLKIHSGPLSKTIRHIFSKMEENSPERCIQIELSRSETTEKQNGGQQKKVVRKIVKSFYDALVFVTDGHEFLDQICFEFGLLECPDKLFDFLMMTLEGNYNKPMFEILKNKVSAEKVNERIKIGKTKIQAIIQIVNFLRQEVLLRFRESMLDCQFISRSLQQEKRRKKQFNTYWRYLSQQSRQNMLLLHHTSISQLHKWLIVNDIFLGEDELKQELQQLLKLEKNDFCNKIFKCKFKKSLSPIIYYYEAVYNLWKKDLDKSKKKRMHKYSLNQKEIRTHGKIQIKQKQFVKKGKNKQNRKSNSLQSNQTNVTDNEKVHQKYQKEQIKLILQKKQEFYQSKQFIKQQKSIQKQSPHKKTRQERAKHKKQQKNKIKIQPKQLQIDLQQIPINPQAKKVQAFPKQKHISRATQQIKQAHLLKLSQQLQDMSDKTSQQANLYHNRRVVAFQRIQYLLAFYNISIRLFGSCASGIAIKNSDIDIAVDNSILTHYDYLPQNLKLLGALESLQQVFASQPCFTYIKVISTASIPVIKLTIDTSVPFLNPSYGQVYQNLNRPHYSGPVQADITIQTLNKLSQCNHLGLISTEAINQWLSEIPSLHTIVIFMKQIFKNYRFNITYEGGLNTFAMIVLLVSYIRHAKLELQTNVALVMQNLLRFYSEQFNQKETGIDLLKHKNSEIFYNKAQKSKNSSKDAGDLEILDPKCEGKNMTRNCYQFVQIKKMFRDILQRCYDKPYEDAMKLYKINSTKDELQQRIKQANETRNVFIEFLTF